MEKGLSSSEEMVTISEVSDVLTCQDRCQEKANCKIFYWKGESSTCKIAENLYENESKIIDEINSVIGRPNCSTFESGWHHSIFITRPQKNQTELIVGSILAVLLIGLIVALVLSRMTRRLDDFFPNRRTTVTAVRIPPMLELEANLEGQIEGLTIRDSGCPNIHIIRLNFIENKILNFVLRHCNIELVALFHT